MNLFLVMSLENCRVGHAYLGIPRTSKSFRQYHELSLSFQAISSSCPDGEQSWFHQPNNDGAVSVEYDLCYRLISVVVVINEHSIEMMSMVEELCCCVYRSTWVIR